jgi:lipoprotein-anchoring transpeptidase ErfK/SrfK
VSSVRRSAASSLAFGILALLAAAPGARGAPAPVELPAAGQLAWPRVAVRAAPDASARRVTVLGEFLPDFRRRVVLALDVATDAEGNAAWYRVSLPGRPNGRTGWVAAASVSLTPMRREIVVRRGARQLELRDQGRLVLRTRVAVGAPKMETPLGTFYVTGAFTPTDPFLGVYAFSTSGYAPLSDWPGGGVVGIHGTSMPWLLGRAVSHGCIRVGNSAMLVLKRFVRLGTPVRVVR